MIWWIIGIYILIGILVTVYFHCKEPVIIEAPWLIPLLVILFPYVIYVLIRINDDLKNGKGGRWI
jgi:UDP-N-acetylmuramyl pentapeptide phosphotransferase/UDP-N-acetylglucosamine-1-phosphate transferase